MSSLTLSLLGAARAGAEAQVPGLIDHEFASRLAAKDYTLWGRAAETEAAQRLGWVSPLNQPDPWWLRSPSCVPNWPQRASRV